MLSKHKDGILNTVLTGISDKDSKETKNHAKTNLAVGLSAIAVAYLAKNFDKVPYINEIQNTFTAVSSSFDNVLATNGYTPLEMIDKLSNIGITPELTQNTLIAVAGYCALKALSSKKNPIQDRLAKYGSEICPYESYVISENHVKGSKILNKINHNHSLGQNLDTYSTTAQTLKTISDYSVKALDFVAPKFRKLLSFVGQETKGFEVMSHNQSGAHNPKLVEELPIPSALSKLINIKTMDIDNYKRTEEKTFVKEAESKAISLARDEAKERTTSLALVKIIDKYKKGTIDKDDGQIMKDLCSLSKNTSITMVYKNQGLEMLSENLFYKLKMGDSGRNPEFNFDLLNKLDIPNFDQNKSTKENAFYIFEALDKMSEKLGIETIKKPMAYEEIYENSLIQSVQTKLRGESSDLALINKSISDGAPVIQEHFEYKGDKPLEKVLSSEKFRSVQGLLHVDPKKSTHVMMTEDEKQVLLNMSRGETNHLDENGKDIQNIENVKNNIAKKIKASSLSH
jgi:hypothetical protein